MLQLEQDKFLYSPSEYKLHNHLLSVASRASMVSCLLWTFWTFASILDRSSCRILPSSGRELDTWKAGVKVQSYASDIQIEGSLDSVFKWLFLLLTEDPYFSLDVFQQIVLALFEVGVLKLHRTISLLFHNACVDVHHLTESVWAHRQTEVYILCGKLYMQRHSLHVWAVIL